MKLRDSVIAALPITGFGLIAGSSDANEIHVAEYLLNVAWIRTGAGAPGPLEDAQGGRRVFKVWSNARAE